MAKKVDTTKDTKAVAVVKNAQDFVPQTSNSSSAMAAHLKFDKSKFAGVEKSVMGEDKELFFNDILMPKVWLVQQMSDVFAEGKAKLGEYIASTSAEVLAAQGEKLEFIVLSLFKRWYTFEVIAGKLEFLSSDIMTKQNVDWKYEDTLEGKAIVRKQVISAYILLVDDVKKGLSTPYVIDFKGTSKGAGRLITTDIATLEKADYPSFVAWFSITSKQEENEKGKFFVSEAKFEGYLDGNNEKLMDFLLDQYNFIQIHKDQIVIDDSDVIKEQSVEQLDQKAQMAKADRAASAKI